MVVPLGQVRGVEVTLRQPPFSKILYVLCKAWLDQARVLLVVPEGNRWDKTEKKWRSLLQKMSVTKLLLPDVPLYRLDPQEAVMPKPSWRTAMYIVSGKNVSLTPSDFDPDVLNCVLKHHKGWRKEEMLKKFPEAKESKEEELVIPKFEVDEVEREVTKGEEQDTEGEEESQDEGEALSDVPSVSTVPYNNDSFTTMDYDDLVSNLFLEEVEPIDAPDYPSTTKDPSEILLTHAMVPTDSIK